jgi:hypothetical protein
MLIEHVDAIVDMRRNQTLVEGIVPGKGPETLANLRETGSANGFDIGARYDWAVDLQVQVAQPGRPVDVLLIAGEGAFDMRYQRSLRALVKVLNKAGVDYAVLGGVETDTGDTARRLGDEATFQQLATQLIATLSTYSFKKIVTADPHVMHSLRNEYRALGGLYEVQHHTSLIAELVASGKLTPAAESALAAGITTRAISADTTARRKHRASCLNRSVSRSSRWNATACAADAAAVAAVLRSRTFPASNVFPTSVSTMPARSARRSSRSDARTARRCWKAW